MTPDQLQDYLKLAPVLKGLPKTSFSLAYDAEADAVYINFCNPPAPADDSELTEENFVICYGKDGEVIGITILNATQR